MAILGRRTPFKPLLLRVAGTAPATPPVGVVVKAGQFASQHAAAVFARRTQVLIRKQPILQSQGIGGAPVGVVVRARGFLFAHQAAVRARQLTLQPTVNVLGPPPAIGKQLLTGQRASQHAANLYQRPLFPTTINLLGPPPAVGRQLLTGGAVSQRAADIAHRQYHVVLKTKILFAAPILPAQIGKVQVYTGIAAQAALQSQHWPVTTFTSVAPPVSPVAPAFLIPRRIKPKGQETALWAAIYYRRRVLYRTVIHGAGPPGVPAASPAIPLGYPVVPRVFLAKQGEQIASQQNRLTRHTEIVSAVFNSLFAKGQIQQTGVTDFVLQGGAIVMTRAPVATDDRAHGYAVGNLWLDTTTSKAYLCTASTVGGAVWKSITLT